jgi:hypothetical protein
MSGFKCTAGGQTITPHPDGIVYPVTNIFQGKKEKLSGAVSFWSKRILGSVIRRLVS